MKLKDFLWKGATEDDKRILIKLWKIYAGLVIFLIIFFIGVYFGLLGPIPSFRTLENPETNIATEIFSSDGVLMGKYYVENRSLCEYNELSPYLVQALMATEDIRFYKHAGVDVRGVLRVFFKTILGGQRSSGGGSTITQQLAKNLFKRPQTPSTFQLISIKLREWMTAIKLERNYTKEEIIAMYLSIVDFGNQSFGIKSAAKTYFNKTPKELTIEESALLVGMLQAPSKYNPIRNPENAKKRRAVVLSQMKKYGFKTAQQFDSLNKLPLLSEKEFQIQDHRAGIAPYFREYLRWLMTASEPRREDFTSEYDYQVAVKEWEENPLYGWCNKNKKPDGSPYNLYTDGLKIYTTIDSRMQKYAEEAVAEHLGKTLQKQFFNEIKRHPLAPFTGASSKKEVEKLLTLSIKRSDRYLNMKRDGYTDEQIDSAFRTPIRMRVFSWNGEKDTTMSPLDSIKYYKWFLRAGFMAVDPVTGYIKAYVGGLNYKYFKYDHVTRSKRQVGSTFKPFVYATVIADRQFTPCSKVPLLPVTIDLGNGQTWTPKNSGNVKEGEIVDLRYALALSINWVSAFLIKNTTPEAVIRLARKMGIKSYIPPVYAIALGVPELTLYEMVGAQTTYANRGIYTEPIFVTRIEDRFGNILAEFKPRHQEAMNAETAYLMIELMKGVVEYGTGARIRSVYGIKYPVAGKTGTTDNNSDGWFMGITPGLVAGAWVGGEDMQIHFLSTSLGQGANMALPIWALFMKKVYNNPSLNIPTGDFEKPAHLSVELDCAKSESKSPSSEKKIKKGMFQ
jgi:penicillin-binding protein 1A